MLVEKLKKSKAKDLYICNCKKKIKTTPMLCKDKITSIFCIIDDILKEINHSGDIPPLAQACSLCPIQNSKFSLRPTCPTRLTCPSPPNPPSPLSLLIPPTSPTCPTPS